MKFCRVRFRNFRLLRDLEVDFSVEPEKPLTVIRAENETGKTTILNALQWVLFGDDGLPSRGAGYRISPIDWDVSMSNTADIEVELEFEHTFERQDEKGGWIESTETYLAHRSATEVIRQLETTRYDESFKLFRKDERGYAPVKGDELVLRQIMGSNLKDLFFTDGDRALSFITSDVSIGIKRKMVQKAIRDMLGFELLQNTRDHVQKALSQIRSQVREFPGGDELTRVATKMHQLEEKESENDKRLSEIDEQLQHIDADIYIAEQKLERALEKGNMEDLTRQKQAKQNELETVRNYIKNLIREHSELFRRESLGQFLLEEYITDSSHILDELKAKGRIPRTAIPILHERLEMGECICGESLMPDTPRYKHITNLIVQQKAASAVDDRLTELRLVASQRLSRLSDPENSWARETKSLIERRNDLEKRIAGLEAELKAIETKIGDLPDIDISFLKNHRKQLQDTKENLAREQSVRQVNQDQLTRDKKTANDELDRLGAKQKQYKRIQYRLTAANDILDVIVTSYKAIEESEIPRVGAAMNKYFLEMIEADPENAIIRKADVTPAYDIAVYGPQDRLLDTDLDLNGAARRALTLAFLLALAEVSDVRAPNVIDTPLGMMSGMVKQSVLRTAVTHTAQLILFLTRSEIAGCEGLIDLYAGRVCTLTNSAHYPRQLKNDPDGSYYRVIRCDCNHHMYCDVCERIADSDNPLLSRHP